MKKILFVFFIFALNFSCQEQSKTPTPSFNGIWVDSNSSDFNNCYAVYSEIGDSIHMSHYLEFKKQPFFETGSGIIKGDSIIYHVDVIHSIPAWGPEGGTHYLKLSKDKNTLRGHFITDTGHKGPLVLKRK